MSVRRVAIACQGGGSQCAFLAGALRALLTPEARERFQIVGLSGTSGGALTAALAWIGLLEQAQGDMAPIEDRIVACWNDLSAQTPQEILLDGFCVQMMRLFEGGYVPGFATSPASFTDLRALLLKHIDFDALPSLVRPESRVLLIGAADVLEGSFKTFNSVHGEISVDSLLASAAVPNVFRAPSWAGFLVSLSLALLVPDWARAEVSRDPDPPADEKSEPHYNDGFVLVPSTDPEQQPYRLKLKGVAQFKYANTLWVEDTFTDHLGGEHEVVKRHDIQLTRSVFYFSGFVFDPKLDFNILIFFSSATLVATAAGYVGYRFHPAFMLRAGYFSLPSTREMTGTYPFFHGTDRSMAVNFFRPGFTQGIWAEGEALPGFRYLAMIGNSLNTLDILATQIDTHPAYSATIWYDHNSFGLPWNDWESHDEPAFRAGMAGTAAPGEERLSDPASPPLNGQTFLSDGILLFAEGALAPDVTVLSHDVFMWVGDAGLKYRGLAVNVELFSRWLGNFEATGPLPISSIHDWGLDASLGCFLWRQVLELYGRSSFVIGEFRTSVEGAVGANWYPFDTRQAWLNVEAIAIEDSPYGGGYYVYSAGQTGVLLQSQLLVRF
jgi:hypothetical protein